MNITIYETWPVTQGQRWTIVRWKPGTWERAEDSIRLPLTWAVRAEINLAYREWQQVQGLA